jgi:hypothetical protein
VPLGRLSAPTLTAVAACLALLGFSVANAAGSDLGARTTAAVCRGRPTKVGGHRAYIYCGRATASLSLGGRTYRFSGGSCLLSRSTLIMNLGESVNGDGEHNGGKTDFGLDVAGDSADVLAHAHGHSLIEGGLTLADVPHGPSGKGAFHGKTALTAEPFTGSWNCHGAIGRF